MTANPDIFLEYYKRELSYLRRMGLEFSRTYPKIAGRLELEADGCPDPHIQRLIESFAFLTGRIQYNIESELSHISSALLGVLYPQFLNPMPSMSIAWFKPDMTHGGLTSGYLIPKNTPIFANSEQGDICRFRTAYPVVLFPVTVSYAGIESSDRFDFSAPAVLRIRLETQSVPFAALSDFNHLRFYINADRMTANTLYELLFCHPLKTAVLPGTARKPVFLPDNAIQRVGFAPDEDVLPYPPNAHSGYRLLHEFFTFPRKFFFFDINLGEQNFSPEDTHTDILILLNEIPKERLVIDHTTFCLGCTPIINLFPKTTEPVRLDQKLTEYPLIADIRREKTTEIHSIVSVSASSDAADTSTVFEPYFSFHHLNEQRGSQAFWHLIRRASDRKDLPGTHCFISFTDLNFTPADSPVQTAFAHTLCTNRRLAEQIPAGGLLQVEFAAPISQIIALNKPTLQIEPPLKGAALWRLISHLSLNHLSLTKGADSLKALREILMLYSFSEYTDTHQQVSGIQEMSCRNVVRRLGTEAWRGFCKGIEITLTFDERLYVGSGAFLLAAVLNHFFPLYASVNTFTQLKIQSRQREGIWKMWSPMIGDEMVF